MKIYDTAGVQRDWAWLRDTFGESIRINTRPNLAEPGFEIVELRAAEGPCALVAQLLGQDGAPAAGIGVARWWADPDLPALPPDLAYWQPRGVHGLTNAEGAIGFGMGAGDGYDPYWPFDQLPVSELWAGPNSDRIHGLGWVWGTNHLHINVTFRQVPAGDDPPGDTTISGEIEAVAGHLLTLALLFRAV